MSENVRLVVWDLDETFWKGTLTEGGIQEYIHHHHEIVIELARRGILSSICSKNRYDDIRQILTEKQIWDYFIFPSINWEPKGPRMARLVDDVQLRAPTVMFIDDNPNNRAEVAATIPGIQIESELFISSVLNDPRFKGKDDSGLSRLKQYKLLEERQRHQNQAVGGTEEFLRSCDIRVRIEYGIEAHLDRAIELINRTNQLNYTKKRLPEDNAFARESLLAQIKRFDRQAGLIHVVDKYGDYGFVGFFMTETLRKVIVEGASNSHLYHFCFSCRTLGMFIEQWVYDRLGMPELNVVGEVLTDLSAVRKIDWVREVHSIESSTTAYEQVAQQIVFWGGCETQAVSVYLSSYTPKLDTYGNYVASGCFVRIASVVHALSICDSKRSEVEGAAQAIGVPVEMVAHDLFATAAHGTLFIFNFMQDVHWSPHTRHKTTGMTLDITPRHGAPDQFPAFPEEELIRFLEEEGDKYDREQTEDIIRVARYIRANFDHVYPAPEEECLQMIKSLIDRLPNGSKMIIAVDHDEVGMPIPDKPGKYDIVAVPVRSRWATLMREMTRSYPHVGVLTYSEAIEDKSEILDPGNHYAREVYLRFALRVVDMCKSLQPKEIEVTPV